MKEQQDAPAVRLVVQSPAKTREVMLALRDWEPEKGLRFSLLQRRSFTLLFQVSTSSGSMARGLALKRLQDEGLDKLPRLEVSVL